MASLAAKANFRLNLRVGLILGALVNLALVLTGILIFPTTLTADHSNGWINVAGIILIHAVYILASFFGPLSTQSIHPKALRTGIQFGLVISVWFAFHILFGILAPLDSDGNANLGLVEFGGLLVLFVIAGAVGMIRSGSVRGGISSAMWSSMIGTLLWFTVILLTYYLFLNTPQEVRGLQSDQVLADFNRSGMSDLRAFIMQDYMGGGFFHMLGSPFIAAVLGGFGSLIVKGFLFVRSKIGTR
ncbi:MAG: hypothetical protein ABI690_31750 [Chloroflexota bacterium]